MELIPNVAQFTRYRAALRAKAAELSGAAGKRNEIAIERRPDPVEEMAVALERELALQNVDREARVLLDVRAALARMDDGTYGVCQECEGEIKHQRLEVLPWASLCVDCQRAAEAT